MSEFSDDLCEVFQLFGPVQVRRMFGGYGVYHQGLMIGLIANDTLYLKADQENLPFFNERNLGPFTYHGVNRTMTLQYCLAPSEIMDDPEQAALWARRSYEAALRAAKLRKVKPKQPKPPAGSR